MASIESREEVYKVLVRKKSKKNYGDDDDEFKPTVGEYYSYTLRGLRNDDEVPVWSKFCEDVFSHKTNPPSAEYFHRHYVNDPRNRCSLIRVATYKNQIVASCRIFLRSVSSAKIKTTIAKGEKTQVLSCGGIGEVCTASDHRRRGLSTALLKVAIKIMKERRNIQISSLHASSNFFPLYESLGYVSSGDCGGNRWSTFPVNVILENNRPQYYHHNTTVLNVRQAKFPHDANQLHQLHKKYSEERLAGCIVRSEEYWSKYISEELKGSLLVLVMREQRQQPSLREADNENPYDYNYHKQSNEEVIVAWLSLRSKNTTTTNSNTAMNDDKGSRLYEIREFGMNLSLLPPDLSSSSPTTTVLSNIDSKNVGTTTTTEKEQGYSFISIHYSFKTLILHALIEEQQQRQNRHENSDRETKERRKTNMKTKTIWLCVPGFLRDEIYFRSSNPHVGSGDINEFCIDWKSEKTNVDNGWMYQVLSTPALKRAALLNGNNNGDDDENNNNATNVNNENTCTSNCNDDETLEMEFLNFIRGRRCNDDDHYHVKKYIDADEDCGGGAAIEPSIATRTRDTLLQPQEGIEHFVWPSDSF